MSAEVELLKTLLGPARLHSSGKAGFKVRELGDNVVLGYFSEKDLPVNIPPAVWESTVQTLKEKFKGLDTDAFFGYVETVRRKQGLYARFNKELTNPGNTRMMESLDPNPKRRPVLPMTQAQLKELPTGKLPRCYTIVNLTVTPDGRTVGKRRIYMTEFALTNKRPDEIIIEYDMGEAELKAVKEKKSFFDIPPDDRVARNMKVHSGDPNRQLGGQALKDHFAKNLETAKQAVEVAVRPSSTDRFGLGLRPDGIVDVTTTDTFLGPVQAKVALDPAEKALDPKQRAARATPVRHSESGRAMRSSTQFSVDSSAGVKLLSPSAKAVTVSNIPEGLDLKELESLAAVFSQELEKILKTFASKKL
jgi:hypothetical protein